MGARPLGSVGNYPPIAFEVPDLVADAAKEGLRLRKLYKRGGTDVGRDRALQLSKMPTVTLRDIVYIRAYFARHVVDNLDERDPPSNGWIAWLLWGGFAGQRWASSSYEWAKKNGHLRTTKRVR